MRETKFQENSEDSMQWYNKVQLALLVSYPESIPVVIFGSFFPRRRTCSPVCPVGVCLPEKWEEHDIMAGHHKSLMRYTVSLLPGVGGAQMCSTVAAETIMLCN